VANELLAVDGTLTLTFGILYALWIYLSPFPARYTWASVFVGCFVTNLAVTAAVYVWLGLPLGTWPPPAPVLILWTAYGLTGGPMIAFQVAKYKMQDQIIQAEMDGDDE